MDESQITNAPIEDEPKVVGFNINQISNFSESKESSRSLNEFQVSQEHFLKASNYDLSMSVESDRFDEDAMTKMLEGTQKLENNMQNK